MDRSYDWLIMFQDKRLTGLAMTGVWELEEIESQTLEDKRDTCFEDIGVILQG